MRIDDQLWPAVREAARRILREDSLTIRTPSQFVEEIDRLVLMMADAQPSRLSFPSVVVADTLTINMEQAIGGTAKRKHIVRLGQEEPAIDVCWIPLETESAWAAIFEACEDLLEAGYPGCAGCGGPNSELPWDEEKFRQIRSGGQ